MNKTKLIILVLCLMAASAGASYGVLYFLHKKGRALPLSLPGLMTQSEAVRAGKELSNGHCKGEGVPYKLSVSPMRAEDFTHIIPYGSVIGGHVTPIDHQYFSPAVFASPKDAYPVYAMADSVLVHYEPHETRIRLIFSVTCTYFYYYDLVTSVVPKIQQGNLPVTFKAGELIGRIGGQTLDFAVWDTTKPLSGFIVPEHYAAEPWKLYTADPLDYYTDELKELALSKYVRTAEPRSGKIDHDIDGKLIGNWFYEGTAYGGRLNGTQTPDYFEGHLAIAPDVYDPTAFILSVGYLEGQGKQNQFALSRSAPSPREVEARSGAVRYELKRWSWKQADGAFWDRMSYVAGGLAVASEDSAAEGCALVQLIETRKLKFETFLGTPCAAVSGFTGSAKTYWR